MSHTRLRHIAGVTLLMTSAASCSPTREHGSITPVTESPTPSNTSTPVAGIAGSTSLEDPVLPHVGNGGFEVEHYDLTLSVTESDTSATLTGRGVITANPSEALSSFSLDLSGLAVDAVSLIEGDTTVDTTFDTADDKLIITPQRSIAQPFAVTIDYSGDLGIAPSSAGPDAIGFLGQRGSRFTAFEPDGARSLFPANDHPSDPATFRVSVDSPDGLVVVASGVPVQASSDTSSGSDSTSSSGTGRASMTTEITTPIPTYALQVAIGDYEFVTDTVDLDGTPFPIRHVVTTSMTEEQRHVLDDTAAQLRFFTDLLGRPPMQTYGILAPLTDQSFALETSSLSLIPYGWITSPNAESVQEVMSHELAHQWFGDHVTIHRWNDLWLSEGFATYFSWLWLEHIGIGSVDSYAADALSISPMLRSRFGAIRDMNGANMWSDNQYSGAAAVVHAVRVKLGDDAFFDLVRRWVTQPTVAARSTDDFAAMLPPELGAAWLASWVDSTEVPAYGD